MYAIAKYVWNIAKKADNLWVQWVDHIYLKKREWWQYKPPQDCSWYWRKICKIKDQFAAGFDQSGWIATKGEYTIKSGYTWKQGTRERWGNSRWIWNNSNIPKHSFICWLAMHRRLQTRDRLAKMGINTEKQCPICGEGTESMEHLFFECEYTKACLRDILEWLQIGVQQFKLEGLWRRMTRNVAGKTCRNTICSILAATIYHIWRVRNDAVWNSKVQRQQILTKRVMEEYRVILQRNLEKKTTTQRQKMWIQKLL